MTQQATPSTAARVRRVVRCVLVAIVVFGVSWPSMARAESLTTIRQEALPAVPGDKVDSLHAVGTSLVALQAGKAWQLPAGAKAWTSLALPSGIPADAAWITAAKGTLYLVRPAHDAASPVGLSAVALERDRMALRALPTWPVPLREVKLAEGGGALHATGLDAEGVPRLFRLALDTASARWTAMPAWPGKGAASSLLAQRGDLYATVPSSDGTMLWRWHRETGWSSMPPAPGSLVGDGARALGQAHLLYLVSAAERAGKATPRMLTFHTITKAWATLPADLPADIGDVTGWADGLAWRNTAGTLHSVQLQSGKHLLTWLDWLVIVVYLAAMIGIGLYFYLREKRNSTENFFVGSRTIPFWAAGLSLYAVNTSSISFIAIPAKAFETNWQYLTNNLIAVLGLMFVAVWIVPLLRRLDLMSTFSYLETRFHPSIRMLASALAIFMQIGSRMSVILFLPALAISTITGIDVIWSVLLMGGFTIIYTAMGGMKAVIWTDVVQVIVKMGGAIFAILFIIWTLRGGFGEFTQIAMAEEKTKLFDFSFDLTKATVWGFIFLVLFEVVLTFPKDQVLMQRVLSTKSDKEAGRSIWAFAAIMIPGGFVFYGIGTALFVYYKNNPERMNPLLPVDATFPLFIAAELPMGVTGLIIAGIFAAAMATLSGIMNSVATLITVDFYERFAKDKSQKKGVFFAEIMTVVVGLVGIGAALVLSRFDIGSLFDVSIELAGLLGGGFAGAYTLGMFTRRANSQGVAIGIVSAIVLTFVAWWYDLVHPYFYLAISILVCVVVGYLASLFFPAPTRSLHGLTIHRQDAPEATG
ncbi:sodium:solute symporter [Pseudoxanthomonas sp. PXM03]|uniref:sodium:solute symporter n=1 Tax=Pseudoxanthomonas sp. PXM03 TaxID=2769284 RepID=UPI00177C493A|nr:sodium:solute symporter [Pseudoxanthomonas sp. PXM03]MBD9434957.1 sodium:solute symporter [Pseudoxanthomonas sp. PXM03]